MSIGLDRFDRLLISELARNARLSNVELGDRVGLSSSAVARRIKALEDDGLIAGYHAEFDFKRLGFAAMATVRVRLDSQSAEAMEAFEKAVAASPSILQCILVSGAGDYQMTVLAKDFADYEQILRIQLAALPRVAELRSDFAIRRILTRALPEQPPPTPQRAGKPARLKAARQPGVK